MTLRFWQQPTLAAAVVATGFLGALAFSVVAALLHMTPGGRAALP